MHRAVKEKLGVDYGEATADGKFILERANFCFGACHLAPMVELEHTFYGKVTPEQLSEMIDEAGAGEGH